MPRLYVEEQCSLEKGSLHRKNCQIDTNQVLEIKRCRDVVQNSLAELESCNNLDCSQNSKFFMPLIIGKPSKIYLDLPFG